MARFSAIFVALIGWATVASAQTRPAAASFQLPPSSFDAAVLARVLSTDLHVEVQRIVAADFDRDGDIDVAAATDGTVLVWMNDGAGRLTQQAPPRSPAAVVVAPFDAVEQSTAAPDDSVPGVSSSLRVGTAWAHAPPLDLTPPCVDVNAVAVSSIIVGPSTPRAPPSVLRPVL